MEDICQPARTWQAIQTSSRSRSVCVTWMAYFYYTTILKDQSANLVYLIIAVLIIYVFIEVYNFTYIFNQRTEI